MSCCFYPVYFTNAGCGLVSPLKGSRNLILLFFFDADGIFRKTQYMVVLYTGYGSVSRWKMKNIFARNDRLILRELHRLDCIEKHVRSGAAFYFGELIANLHPFAVIHEWRQINGVSA